LIRIYRNTEKQQNELQGEIQTKLLEMIFKKLKKAILQISYY